MMNDGMLSQDEIDALLNVGAEDDEDNPVKTEAQEGLTNIEKDTLGEIGNISFGSSATTLSTLLNQKVEITTPTVTIINRDELNFAFEPVSVQVKYVEGFTGQNVFVIKMDDAAIISDIMLGGDGTNPAEELNEIHLSAVQEAMNQMMGAAATSMSTVFNKRIDISPPTIYTTSTDNLSITDQFQDEDTFVKVSFELKVGTLIDSSIMQLIPITFAREMVNQLLSAPAAEETAAVMEEIEKPAATKKPLAEPEEKPDHDRNPSLGQHAEPQFLGNRAPGGQTHVQDAEFSSFAPVRLNQNEQRNLDMLLDIPLKVTVELGRTKRTIKDILDLTSGSIIELDKLAGEPVDILVNEKLVAEGEVVVIDENFGVRVTDIISQRDRLLKLK